MSSADSFPYYTTNTHPPGPALYVFVAAYTSLCFLLIAPLVIWGRRQEKKRQLLLDYEDLYHKTVSQGPETGGLMGQPMQPPDPPSLYDIRMRGIELTETGPSLDFGEAKENEMHVQQNQGLESHDSIFRLDLQQPGAEPKRKLRGVNNIANIFRELDRLATTAYPDEDPDFMSAMSGSVNRGRNQSYAPSSAASSNAISVATTSRIHYRTRVVPTPKTRVWDVGGRRWKNRRPIGRADVIHRAIHSETQSMASSSRGLPPTAPVNNSNTEGPPLQPLPKPPQKAISEVAGSVLSEDLEDAPESQKRAIFRSRKRHSHSRGASFSSASDPSFLPAVVDDIMPHDAADADDPGRVNSFDEVEPVELTICCGPGALWKPLAIGAGVDGLIELADPDVELKRILGLGLPLTLGAISESVFRAITIGFISHSIGTDSMVAYILVEFLIGLTDELVGAITDAESMLCSHALSLGDFVLTGQYVQIAVMFNLALNVPILTLWALFMPHVIEWLVKSPNIASIALAYTRIVVYYHMIQSVSRVITVLFHLTFNEHFETIVKICEGAVTLVTVTCMLSLEPNLKLEYVGWIQVIIGTAVFVAKITYAVARGWVQPFCRGLVGKCALCQNSSAVKDLVVTSLPLFIGAFLEYAEWELFIIFVAHLGPAEVAAWTLLGVIWKVFETSTEGIGEAAAIRVAYHLGTGNPDMARKASYKAVFLSTVQSFFVTSILFMLGKNLATWLTTDPVIQHLFNNAITLLGLGNVVMTYAMISWSLVGAQGRYRLATLVILLTRWFVAIPMVVICIYGKKLDLNCVMGSVIVGFATACMSLAYVLLRSDWGRLSRILQELNAMGDTESSGGSQFDEGASDTSPPLRHPIGDCNSDLIDLESKDGQRVSRRHKGPQLTIQ